jgi:hypothetical protein
MKELYYQPIALLSGEFEHIFRFKLGSDPPANVKPLVITLRDSAENVRM